jgi:hypothetical protein
VAVSACAGLHKPPPCFPSPSIAPSRPPPPHGRSEACPTPAGDGGPVRRRADDVRWARWQGMEEAAASGVRPSKPAGSLAGDDPHEERTRGRSSSAPLVVGAVDQSATTVEATAVAVASGGGCGDGVWRRSFPAWLSLKSMSLDLDSSSPASIRWHWSLI